MPKYMFRGSYSSDGVRGFLSEGGSGREAAAAALAESVGGALESYYFAFGPHDFFAIADLPDHAAAVAVAASVGATGAMSTFETIPLLTPQEMDEAVKRTPSYRAPGA